MNSNCNKDSNNVTTHFKASRTSGDLFQESSEMFNESSYILDEKNSLDQYSRKIACKLLTSSQEKKKNSNENISPSDINPKTCDSGQIHCSTPVNNVSISNSLVDIDFCNETSQDRSIIDNNNAIEISFVSESVHSELSSVLEDSFVGVVPKNCFRTPLHGSRKTQDIQQWLNNLTLDSKFKSCQNSSNTQTFSPESKSSCEHNISDYSSSNKQMSSRSSSSDEFEGRTSIKTSDQNISTNSVYDDESFRILRSSRKKKNYLHISSGDSEDKDTADECEEVPGCLVEPFTPKRKLYFRNPLNNSLDDEAEQLHEVHGDEYSNAIVDDKTIVKKSVKNSNLLNQIYSEVLSGSPKNDPIIDKNQDLIKVIEPVVEQINLNNSLEITRLIELNSSNNLINNTSYHNFTEIPCKSFVDTEIEVEKKLTNESYHSNTSSDKSQRFSDLDSLNESHDSDINKGKNSYESSFNKNPNAHSEMNNSSFEENEAVELAESYVSNVDSNLENDKSFDSIKFVKKKSKKDRTYSLNADSTKDTPSTSDISGYGVPSKIEVNSPVNTISPNTRKLFNLPDSSQDDKYIYRARSDSSCSEVTDKSSLGEVISLHSSTSEKHSGENYEYFNLATYLKKNTPATHVSILDSTFLQNIEKKKSELDKIILPTQSLSPEHNSFLLSLTNTIPDEICHPDALKYRGKSYSKNKNELINLMFKLFNKDIFENKLPLIEIKWSGHLTTTSGITKSVLKRTNNRRIRISVIKLSKTIVNDSAKLRDVLLHELCHAANWLIDETSAGHGPLFKKWVNKIWIKYPEIPKVETTHHYELKWKYLFKCTYCGYEKGKMKMTLKYQKCYLCGGEIKVIT